jgi:hypothetical protein
MHPRQLFHISGISIMSRIISTSFVLPWHRGIRIIAIPINHQNNGRKYKPHKNSARKPAGWIINHRKTALNLSFVALVLICKSADRIKSSPFSALKAAISSGEYSLVRMMVQMTASKKTTPPE